MFAAGVGLCAVAALSIVPSLGEGSSAQRGGNHNCNPSAGTFYESHFWEAGDRISIGFKFDPAIGPPPVTDQDSLRSRNVDADSGAETGLGCGADVGAWQKITSALGPGDDSVRLDARGIPLEGGEPFEPIPKSIDSELSGGAGGDTIRGHKGFDDISGGSGPDTIKADDGKRDVVNCGSGKDKADVDSKDDVSGCETET